MKFRTFLAEVAYSFAELVEPEVKPSGGGTVVAVVVAVVGFAMLVDVAMSVELAHKRISKLKGEVAKDERVKGNAVKSESVMSESES